MFKIEDDANFNGIAISNGSAKPQRFYWLAYTSQKNRETFNSRSLSANRQVLMCRAVCPPKMNGRDFDDDAKYCTVTPAALALNTVNRRLKGRSRNLMTLFVGAIHKRDGDKISRGLATYAHRQFDTLATRNPRIVHRCLMWTRNQLTLPPAWHRLHRQSGKISQYFSNYFLTPEEDQEAALEVLDESLETIGMYEALVNRPQFKGLRSTDDLDVMSFERTPKGFLKLSHRFRRVVRRTAYVSSQESFRLDWYFQGNGNLLGYEVNALSQ